MPQISLPISLIVKQAYKFVYSNFWTVLKLCIIPLIIIIFASVLEQVYKPVSFGTFAINIIKSCAVILIAIPIHRMIILGEKPIGLFPISDYKMQFLLFLFFSLLYDFAVLFMSFFNLGENIFGYFIAFCLLSVYAYLGLRLCVIFPFLATRSNEGLSHLNFGNFFTEIWVVGVQVFSLTKNKFISLLLVFMAVSLPVIVSLLLLSLFNHLIGFIVPAFFIFSFLAFIIAIVFFVVSNVAALSISFMLLEKEKADSP